VAFKRAANWRSGTNFKKSSILEKNICGFRFCERCSQFPQLNRRDNGRPAPNFNKVNPYFNFFVALYPTNPEQIFPKIHASLHKHQTCHCNPHMQLFSLATGLRPHDNRISDRPSASEFLAHMQALAT
jgi:hypothetical protein